MSNTPNDTTVHADATEGVPTGQALAVIDPRSTTAVPSSPPQMMHGVAIARPDPLLDAVNSLAQVAQLAGTLLASGFLPRAINTEAKAVAVMLTGREMGIGPMQAIRSVNIIDAKPVVAADLQLALFKRAGGRSAIAVDAEAASITLRHPNGDEVTETYTMKDAAAAGLLHKDNWKKHPKAMLRSRVITAALKSIGFEATTGVYDPDEADAFDQGGNAGGSEASRPLPTPSASRGASSAPTQTRDSSPTSGGTSPSRQTTTNAATSTNSSRTSASANTTSSAIPEYFIAYEGDEAVPTSRYAVTFPYAPNKGIPLDAVEENTPHAAYVIDDEALERAGQWCAQKLHDKEKPAKNPEKLVALGTSLDAELRRRSALADLAASDSAGV